MKSANFLAVFALLAFVVGAALLGTRAAQQAADGGVAAVDARLAALAPGFFVFRAALATAVVGGWPWLVRHAARRFRWNPPVIEVAAGLRWRVLLWFAVFELLMIQGGRIVHLAVQ